MSAVVLLPCPFCGDDGDKGRQTVTQMTGDRNVFDRVLCRCCGAMAPEANWQQRASTETKHEEAQTVEPVGEVRDYFDPQTCNPSAKYIGVKLTSLGQKLPHGTKLFTHPAPPPSGERAALIAQVDMWIGNDEVSREDFASVKALLQELADMLAADVQQVAVPHGFALVDADQMREVIRDIHQHIQQGHLSEEVVAKQSPSYGTGIYTHLWHQMRKLSALLAASPQPPQADAQAPWCPDVCPITGLPFFMWLEHHETGVMTPTYGGPYDSYTIPVRSESGDYLRERYDHDRGGWLVDEREDVGIQIVDNQLYVSDEPPQAERVPMTEMVDAAMVEMQTIHPPMRRSDCERLIRAALDTTQTNLSNKRNQT